MGLLFLVHLEGNFYSCKHCHAHLALLDDIISKHCLEGFLFLCIILNALSLLASLNGRMISVNFRCKSFHCWHGKAYLFNKVVNVMVGQKMLRMMTTGLHTVSDIFCVGCGSILGWKYEAAYEKGQKYKEGKFILERFKVLGPDASHNVNDESPAAAVSDAEEA